MQLRGRSPALPNVVPGIGRGVQGAAARRPRHALHLRHQHRLARPGGRGRGRRRRWTWSIKEQHHRPARHGRHDVPPRRASATRTASRVHVPGEDGAWVSGGEILNQTPDWWAGGHGLYSTPRDYIRFERALLRGGELDGERILRRSTVDAAFTNQIGDLDFPRRDPDRRPADHRDVHAGPGLEVGLRPAAEHRGPPGHAPGRHRRLGGPVQHPLLRGPHHRDLRVDLHATRCRSSPRGPGRPTRTSSGRSTRRCRPSVRRAARRAGPSTRPRPGWWRRAWRRCSSGTTSPC